MHCSQRIIIKDIHRLTPTGGSLKYAIFDDRILFFAFALCSVPKLALKYFNVNPFLQVNKNSHFFKCFSDICTPAAYFSCENKVFLSSALKTFMPSLSFLVRPGSVPEVLRQISARILQAVLPHTFSKDDPTGNDREYRLKAHDH